MSSYSIGRYLGKGGYNHTFFIIYKGGELVRQIGLQGKPSEELGELND